MKISPYDLPSSHPAAAAEVVSSLMSSLPFSVGVWLTARNKEITISKLKRLGLNSENRSRATPYNAII